MGGRSTVTFYSKKKMDRDLISCTNQYYSQWFHIDNVDALLKKFVKDNTYDNNNKQYYHRAEELKEQHYIPAYYEYKHEKVYRFKTQGSEIKKDKFELYANRYIIPQGSKCKLTCDNCNNVDTYTMGVQGIYSFVDYTNNKAFDKMSTDINGIEKYSIYVQLPLYIMQTSAEVLISITGLDYVYSEAPVKLKSVLSSLWLLMVSLGQIPTLIITSIPDLNTHEIKKFNLLTIMVALMVPVMMLTAWLYKPVVRKKEEDYNEEKFEKISVTSKDEKTQYGHEKTTNL